MPNNFSQYTSLLESISNYKLTDYPSEPFGMKSPIYDNHQIGYIPVDKPKCKKITDFISDNQALPEDLTAAPDPWEPLMIFDILAIISGEFDLLVPFPNYRYNFLQIARSLMQCIEAYSDAGLFVENTGWPQDIKNYVPLVQWLRRNYIITSSMALPWENNEGIFHERSFLASMRDITRTVSI